ncbi:ABC-2 type transport system ATP-binding protein [Carnobacterium iners]|uniref:ABC-2 type transport system ATP-binding protein n=1 Tax=Carnobacterium iners TaxID=1073423 RepID=A0A1X7MRH1_9LACT|nr:ABC transporter ATP-binding protein [Carnobacterium iners]SEK93697.1 ABC-2 type transport system ATP-binding protein [Carnobacterium iners]SMH26717.1 ABC-2 type transport system ATP-binding protein [Carnobacterium iners]
MDISVLKVSNLAKKIKKNQIIKEINLDIKQGEILAFLGPNGSGKTTTLRMIVGLLKPTSGEITICGHSIEKDFVKAMSNVGCIIEGPDLYDYMSGYKNLELLGSMSKNVTKKDIDEAVELVGMGERIHDKVAIYSMGMKQRVGLAQALIHKPNLLILDEPTNGLDPQGIHEFREIVKKLAKEKGIAVLISSHLISEVQLMCDRVSIINNGTIIRNTSIDEVLSTGEVVWTIDNPEKAQLVLKKRFDVDSTINATKLTALVDLEKLLKINKTLFDLGFEIKYVENKKRTLEDLFLTLTDRHKIG